MKLFNFQKKKTESHDQPHTEEEILLHELVDQITKLNYTIQVDKATQIIIVNDQLLLEFRIIRNPDYAKELMHLMINTAHPTHFPDGIMESIAGIGETVQDRIASVVENYITSTFKPIAESLTDTHSPEYDFISDEVLWHPALSDLRVQGSFNRELSGDELYLLLVSKLESMLSRDQKFHWLKMYISKQQSGEIIGDCLLDNEPWDEGLDILADYISTFPVESTFIGIKQFVVFRRCDKYD
ncbi:MULTISPECIES: DUF6348 family protein [Myroides]|uniref:Uncharacterized protein n=2 Tax=Myroides odoratimimus TaxID=76832 RepID=A0A0S7EMF8_9FLAO|nr:MULTISPECIES: DUF6348 family protein [Myroides]ALU26730.1 hypothetical protein AS202_11480 [Myroides odoratimimus]APA92749.1 hypothetical protein BK054_11085 [Myroides sp. ZB35]EHO12847.1 hypothetical protein HMPREF9714_01217 [Myroides odoratimimus CCUG 12901]EHO12869.1 hypothetical protein HMPREF9712_00016 [Myroides odoratimimus CCUG 10230]MDM1035097.1 hypothetical protein [Myroides odoratimimus]